MEIKYNVQAPPKGSFNGGVKSEEVKAIEDFLTSHKRKWNQTAAKKYDAYRVKNCIYIVRLTGKKG